MMSWIKLKEGTVIEEAGQVRSQTNRTGYRFMRSSEHATSGDILRT